MKGPNIIHALLASGIAGVAGTEPTHDVPPDFDTNDTAIIQKEFDGWVNPEDVAPMPQCIAQQDRSAWLGAMTKCTQQRCTSHFAFICTNLQWLTQLSCLSVELSPNVIENYISYCERSILAKAQLYHWVRNVTDRTWLVDVGDANGLQELSPSSLAMGYASMGVASTAPPCLSRSRTSTSLESFEHVLGFCSFTSSTLHTGNSARPWEYSKSQKSILALSFDTAGYDLTGAHIPFGEYFDRECFCSTFTFANQNEPCLASDQVDLTMERLWLNATCGSASLPGNWTAALKITGFDYISLVDWHWPRHVTDMPKPVTDLAERCATDACRVDADGYCVVEHAMDRACFCSKIDYDSCQGSCRVFESRIGFVKWLHDLCGNVDGWHGLPSNWSELATPLPSEMIPWRWVVRPNNSSGNQCWPTKWKLGSFALVNLATAFAVLITQRRAHPRSTVKYRFLSGLPWLMGCILLASLPLGANWINSRIIHSTPGYEAVPMSQLVFFFCSLPRLSWLTIAPAGSHLLGATEWPSAAISLYAETIVQVFALYHMFWTVNYGRQHNFYFGGLANAKGADGALLMYVGALAWLLIIAASCFQLMRAIRSSSLITRRNSIMEDLLPGSRSPPPAYSERDEWTTYGTLPTERKEDGRPKSAFTMFYATMAILMPLIWIAQWLFWIGFVNLSSDEYVATTNQILRKQANWI
ncbi:hypothetical protein NLG97_g2255 [Lecanicillium saksenae]|uniref:Uncharacterized protein n=1 Tax=Lecanicillium saksenae TaxID=468837 RepID=A0ACC1R1F6_9HYPO|nr:hypothetical protein NLG97_g2255 [Lecanicillium saksenae]